MTNAEKFEEVFGYEPNKNLCYAPEDVECPTDCDDCPYISWLNEEYIAKPKQKIEMHPDCKECEWKDPSQAQCYDGHIQRIGCKNIRKQEKESKKQGEKRHEY